MVAGNVVSADGTITEASKAILVDNSQPGEPEAVQVQGGQHVVPVVRLDLRQREAEAARYPRLKGQDRVGAAGQGPGTVLGGAERQACVHLLLPGGAGGRGVAQ